MATAKGWGDIKRARLTPAQIEGARKAAARVHRAITLRQLREDAGKTQTELAELTELTQSALSRIERREDNPIEAVRRYVEALGGEVEVVAVLGKNRLKLLGV